MSNFFNYSSFPGIRPRSDVDAADMSCSSAARRIAADVVVAAGVLALFGVVACCCRKSTNRSARQACRAR